MSLAALGVALLLQCKGLAPVSVPAPLANSSGCGMRFWRPVGWTQEVLKRGGSLCEVGLMPSDWRDDHAKADYALRLSVHMHQSAPEVRTNSSPFAQLGFWHDNLGWHPEGSVPFQMATEVEGTGWKGLAQSIHFSAYDQMGHYRGTGEGDVAGLVGPGGELVYVEAHVGITLFNDFVCSIRFDSAPSAQ